ncbi:hypothetical protein J7I98_35180 [Streptomyces sp. ISL-98]|uniref:hypothetical protein n=1 Tax=Streptomyces sp. ISL-98 TaxID=2819192 RepID=UPI001BEBD48B|nr:hypothetical protein [Streptomyces sp. ISL-98]MBT2510974.1 hypothetical protein [Streptomyces sp. ISL-98]
MNREQDMAHHDISLRLADATDEVEVGIAPYEAVMRGGKRRKARRWVLGTAVALVMAGSTGTLALAVVDGREQSYVAAHRQSAEERHVYTPQRTQLTEIYGRGTTDAQAYVSVELWGAPRTEAEARKQKERMIEYGVWDERKADPEAELGRDWFSVVVIDAHGGKQTVPVFGLRDKSDDRDGMSFKSYEFTVKGTRLTVGYVGPEVKRLEYEYDDGTVEPELMKAAGFKGRWFTLEGKASRAKGDVAGIRVFDAKEVPRTVQVG